MKNRPSDLPDYGKPPVTEVVLGVQFNGLSGLLAPHLGLIWEAFRGQFPEIEQHPPLDPVFETFPEGGVIAQLGRMQLQLMSGAETPRIFLVSANKNELLQIQRDRFLHNWRKLNDVDVYPHFEQLLNTFSSHHRQLENLIGRLGIGEITPNQCEVSYINQIPVPQGETMVGAFERLFGGLRVTTDLGDLGKPEDARFMIRYVIRDRDGKPIGRLHISADPAVKPDGTNIVQLSLVARGRPASPSLDAVCDLLLNGRRLIVQSFDRLTSPRMHELWEKKS